MPGLEWLPEQTRAHIHEAASAAEAALAERLLAVCLIGAAAGPNRNYRGGMPELLVVAQTLDPALLHDLALGLAGPLRAGLQIRTVTALELLGSTDVHALEIAEWRARNVVLAGDDPFASLEITPSDLRHELERALRTLSHRLRNRVLWCLATDQRRLDPVLREALERLTMIGYHTLELRGENLPLDEAKALERFVAWLDGDSVPLLTLRNRLLSNGIPEDPLAELTALSLVTEAACAKIDVLLV
ncbi:hypothetical protein G6O69_18015 [Pseudenhygromyxa sp. WMMC2535]|uniref:hypothetical protein n=1 Tax=Pseudenhygromyxa sp. WMMC2535 TaxID=2712867 RepID=UPI001553E4C6|nr:hypothetical protein [Pseudenhygromyxa sp. WMMC2535]NVB39745.1 hypothetical protein [Pseudenhygromyxa sp. WMMC2535]